MLIHSKKGSFKSCHNSNKYDPGMKSTIDALNKVWFELET